MTASMNITAKNAARSVGILFLVQMTAAVISHSVILVPLLRGEHFLANISANDVQVRIAMLLELVTGASVFAISVLLFPILKKHNESIALWYVGLRLTEWVIALISGMFILTVLAISKEYVQPGIHEPSFLPALSENLLELRDSIRNLMLLCFCLSAVMFYFLLFRSRLVPRFISVWGLIGVILLFAEVVSSIFGTSLGGIIVMLPMGVNEIFLGIWLITRGFNQSVIIPEKTNW
jgi:hypothetical protein